MSKIVFEDKSYVEVVKSQIPNKVLITIAAKNKDNPSVIAHSVEITEEQFKELSKI